MSGTFINTIMASSATFITVLLPIVGFLGLMALIIEGIVPYIVRRWQSKENNRQIVKLIAKSRNY